jgi:hypothetical protein
MNFPTGAVIGIASLIVAPAAAAMLNSGAWPTLQRNLGKKEALETISFRTDNKTNIPVTIGSDQSTATLRADSGPTPPLPSEQVVTPTTLTFEPFPPFGGISGPPPFGRLGGMPPSANPPLTRVVCEEEINRGAALAGYLKSKLRLHPNQREAWEKFERAADSALEKLHAACEHLPIEVHAQPSLSNWVDLIDEQLSSRIEFVRSVREPLGALADTLSPEQRETLQPLLLQMTRL